MAKKIIKTFCIVAVLLCSCVKPKVSNSIKSCDQSNRTEKLEIKDWEGSKIQISWSDHAGSSCPGPGFPNIQIKDSRVQAYLHVVEVNMAPEHNAGWGWNLEPTEPTKWIFLDIGSDSRARKWPFYNANYGSSFYDNPAWAALGGNSTLVSRQWQGRLYGIAFNSTKDSCRPVWGVKWGFEQFKGKNETTPLRPKALDSGDWLKDLDRVKRLGSNSCL